MTQQTRRLLLLSLVACLGLACSQFRITTEEDVNFNFARVRTFSLRDARIDVPEPDVRERRAQVLEMIRSILTEKGYSEAGEEQADLWITFDAATNEPSADGDPLTPNEQWGGYDAWARYHPQGKLAIHCRNPEDDHLVWHGFAHTVFYEGEDRDTRAVEAVKEILKTFPKATP